VSLRAEISKVLTGSLLAGSGSYDPLPEDSSDESNKPILQNSGIRAQA